jgi:hypothetical protein
MLPTLAWLLVVTANARADMAPPPTFLIDSLWLGWPAGPIVGLALASTAVAAFLWLRKHITRRWPAVVLCLVGYCAANLGIYVYALGVASENRRSEKEKKDREQRQRDLYRPRPSVTNPAPKGAESTK